MKKESARQIQRQKYRKRERERKHPTKPKKYEVTDWSNQRWLKVY